MKDRLIEITKQYFGGFMEAELTISQADEIVAEFVGKVLATVYTLPELKFVEGYYNLLDKLGGTGEK